MQNSKMASAKKKISQHELRQFMKDQKKKLESSQKKIESPLARYDKDGVLHCIACDTIVRSEAVWSVHLNSKNHKQNLLNRIKKNESPNQPTVAPPPPNLKRPAPPPIADPPKKIKSILKNSKSVATVNDPIKFSKPNQTWSTSLEKSNKSQINNNLNNKISNESDNVEEVISNEVLPEGFFDDPKLDAKVRNVEYRDPIEEEWEQFQKEIKEEANKAQQIIADDQEEATTERQIDEIDEQIRNWSRVVTLEKKKESVNITVPAPMGQKAGPSDELSDDDEFEEFLDWRSKKSFDHKQNKVLST